MKTNYSEKISICQNKQKNLCLFEVSKWKMIVGVFHAVLLNIEAMKLQNVADNWRAWRRLHKFNAVWTFLTQLFK